MAHFHLGTRTVSLDAFAVVSPDGRTALTPLEVEVLRCLYDADGVVSQKTLLVDVWGYSPNVQTRAIHHTITRLRRKLEDDPSSPRFLKTIRGVGYELQASTRDAKDPSLPPMRPMLFGRQDALRELATLVQTPGLVTLLGPGGVGKTCLLTHFLQQYDRPSQFCDLSHCTSVDAMVAHVCDALAIPATTDLAALGHAVSGQGLGLLALDNVEQAADAAHTLVTGLLSVVPNVCIVTTSRVVLNHPNERVWPVTCLTPPDGQNVDGAETNPAVALFVDRVRRVHPEFDMTPSTLGDVVDVVRAVDGLPLALELAAPRTRVLSMADLARRLRHDIQLLASRSDDAASRHRSLTVVLSRSWQALCSAEQRLFAQLSIFAGSFSLEAVEYIADDTAFAVECIQSLVEQSLVVSTNGRMRLLVPIRSYATAQLSANPPLAAHTIQRHRTFYAKLGTTAQLRAAECSPTAARQLVKERHNLVSACGHSIQADDASTAMHCGLAAVEGLRANANHGACLDLAEQLSHLATLDASERLQVELVAVRSLHEIGRRAEALQRLEHTKPCTSVTVNAMRSCLLGEFRHLHGDADGSTSALSDALQLTEGPQHTWTHALMLSTAARVAGERGQASVSRQRHETCLSLLTAQGRHCRVAPIAVNFANQNRDLGNVDDAIRWYELAIDSAQATGSQRVEAVARCNRAAMDADYGRVNAADDGFERGISQLRHIGDLHFEGICLGIASELYIDNGQLDRAEQALVRARACHSTLNESLWVRVVEGRLAVLNRAKGEYAQSITVLEGLLPLLQAPLPLGYGMFVSQLARARAQSGDIDGAVRDFDDAQKVLGGGQWTSDLAASLASEATLLAVAHPQRAQYALAEAARLQRQLNRPTTSRLGKAVERARLAQACHR